MTIYALRVVDLQRIGRVLNATNCVWWPDRRIRLVYFEVAVTIGHGRQQQQVAEHPRKKRPSGDARHRCRRVLFEYHYNYFVIFYYSHDVTIIIVVIIIVVVVNYRMRFSKTNSRDNLTVEITGISCAPVVRYYARLRPAWTCRRNSNDRSGGRVPEFIWAQSKRLIESEFPSITFIVRTGE